MSGLIGPGGHDVVTHLSFSLGKGPGQTARVCSRRGGPAGGIRVAAAARAAESHPCPWVEWPRGRCFEPAGVRPPLPTASAWSLLPSHQASADAGRGQRCRALLGYGARRFRRHPTIHLHPITPGVAFL